MSCFQSIRLVESFLREIFVVFMGLGVVFSVFCFIVRIIYFFCIVFQVWMNEKFVFEFLESKVEIVECVMEQFEYMVRVICFWIVEEQRVESI